MTDHNPPISMTVAYEALQFAEHAQRWSTL